MIKRKPCKCGCGKMPTISFGGYNHKCAPEEIKEKFKIRKTETNRRMLERSISKLKNSINPDIELEKYFSAAWNELNKNPYCEECGNRIPRSYFRASTAHVLPKRKEFGFPSVAANIKNKLFLGAPCGCHAKYDKSWEDAQTMKVWVKAVFIFRELYPMIDPLEYKNIPECLLQFVPHQ